LADNFRFAQLQPFSLAGSGAIIGATSITLKSMLDIDGTALSMAGTFGAIGYGTLEPGNGANEEQISFTGLVNNANGTTTLSGVKNVSFVYPYTETSGLSKTHAGSTTFIISNTSGYYNKFVAKNNDGTVAETLTFTDPNIPEMNSQTVLSTDDAQFITKYHFDTNGGNTSNFNRTVVAGVAGETIAVDQLVYLKVSDGRWWLCDADTAATVENVILGISQGSGTAGNSITNGVLTNGLNTFSALTLTANTKYFASNTAGGFSSSAGTFEVSLGESQTTTTFLFNPRFDQQLTENQQDALAGDNTDITVGAGNLLVTQTGLQKSAEVYAASSTGNDTYVVTLSPVPTSLVNGMTIRVKFDVPNTGASTLNVNGLGALAIVTGVSTATATGDIVANLIGELIYNSTGTVWQLVNPASAVLLATTYTNGQTTRDLSTASGNQTIAHGLGKIPKKVKITAIQASTSGVSDNYSFGAYNGTTNSSIYRGQNGNTQYYVGGDNTNTINIMTAASNDTSPSTATVTVDATNITLAWTKATTATGTAYLLWEAEG
jgi:hypothetical protein